jgi:coenzyme F420-reducing hydrogenase alpha subunit
VSIEGELQIELVCRDQRVDRVNIRSSRPLQLPLVFESKPVEDALRMLPMLYSVCATAQAQAAVMACRQAMGVSIEPKVSMAESMLVWCETGREHLWRILIDWPTFCGESPEPDLLKDLPKLMRQAKAACFDQVDQAFTLQPELKLDAEGLQQIIDYLSQTSQQAVFGESPQAWYEIESADDFHRWIDSRVTMPARLLAAIKEESIGGLGGSESQPIPDFEAEEIGQRLRDAYANQFVATPDWNGEPCETTALTRQAHHPLIKALKDEYGNGLITRMAARLLELASIPSLLLEKLNGLLGGELQATARARLEGTGIGIVEAARGRLTHKVSVHDGLIRQYQIVAPTEWNFHPDGLVSRGLQGLKVDDEAAFYRQASLFINAVDPCVGYQLELV